MLMTARPMMRSLMPRVWAIAHAPSTAKPVPKRSAATQMVRTTMSMTMSCNSPRLPLGGLSLVAGRDLTGLACCPVPPRAPRTPVTTRNATLQTRRMTPSVMPGSSRVLTSRASKAGATKCRGMSVHRRLRESLTEWMIAAIPRMNIMLKERPTRAFPAIMLGEQESAEVTLTTASGWLSRWRRW